MGVLTEKNAQSASYIEYAKAYIESKESTNE